MQQNNHDDRAQRWCVYILQCNDKSLYTGITVEPLRRVEEHNRGDKLAARYTRGRRPVTLVYQEYCPSRATAASREAAIKKLSRTQKLALIAQCANPPSDTAYD
ncbi:GIY-YIG nuclease family protein [Thiohalophilus thiocyanatoxydans]|uniref:Putative endonuclease n=1 Tax=Thiohalophilus thiocyanatoxydans TaxID=381308 RepID=A0A4R8INU0_9GAMM|nr:GIY-YIG nuclease family protein [Thiohalophilus thiocyanatoxydans]TDY02562.1 putative endonuclease [Thiohalophilus thiocyanatoxydans]